MAVKISNKGIYDKHVSKQIYCLFNIYKFYIILKHFNNIFIGILIFLFILFQRAIPNTIKWYKYFIFSKKILYDYYIFILIFAKLKRDVFLR